MVSGFSFTITHHCKIFLSLLFSQNFLDCFHSVSILTGKHCHFYFLWLKAKGEYDSIHLRIIWIISKAPAYNIVSNVFLCLHAFFFQLSWHKVMSLISAYLAFLFFRLMNVLLQLVLNPQNFTWGLVFMTGLDNCMPSSWVLFKQMLSFLYHEKDPAIIHHLCLLFISRWSLFLLMSSQMFSLSQCTKLLFFSVLIFPLPLWWMCLLWKSKDGWFDCHL